MLIEIADENIPVVIVTQSQYDPTLPPGAVPTGIVTDALTGLKRTIGEVVSSIGSGLAELAQPDEISVEFGVAFKGTGGVPVVVSHSAEATFKITAKWTRASSPR